MTKRKPKDTYFQIVNERTGKTIIVNSDANLRSLNAILDAVSSADMLKKAEVEQNSKRKAMMLLYARRKAEIEQKG